MLAEAMTCLIASC